MLRRTWVKGCIAAMVLAGCDGCDDDTAPLGGKGGEGGAGAGQTDGAGGSGGEGGGVSASFLQAFDGAMLANPDVYAAIPIHIGVTGGAATSVTLTLDGDSFEAADDDQDGTWDVLLPIADRPEGELELTVHAEPSGGDDGDPSVTLVLDRDGAQLTDFSEVGTAETPRVFRQDDALWLTYTDRSGALAEAWLQRIDGAFRRVGAPIPLVGAAQDTLYARTLPGPGRTLGVLYQSPGQPYATHFLLTDLDGNATTAPSDLDLPDSGAYYGGDIAFDGTSFLLAYKTVDVDSQKLLFTIVDATSGEVSGPHVVATSGAGTQAEPDGEFLGFSPVSIEPTDDGAVITFTRDLYNDVLELTVPTTYVVRVDKQGGVQDTRKLTTTSFLFHREAKLTRIGDEILTIFSATDLTDSSDNPPYLFYSKRALSSGEFANGPAHTVFDAVDDRDDPFLIEHPTQHAVLAWTDHRSYTERGLENGRIELYVAPFSSDLETGTPVVFPHARFVAGLSDLNGTLLGSNLALGWVDERHGLGIADPKPEIYLETVWY